MAKKIVAIILAVVDVILLGVIIVSAATGWRIGGNGQEAEKASAAPTEVRQNPTVGSDETSAPTQAPEPTEAPTEKPTEAVTEAPTEAETEVPVETPTKASSGSQLPYMDTLGKPKETDFVWVKDAADGKYPENAVDLCTDDILGKWKAEFIFDGIWEMVYITIGLDGSVTVQPYQINYGSGWEYEESDPPYTLTGSFTSVGVNASGQYGTMELYKFYESADKQYGVGTFKVSSGATVPVGLVRP